MLKCSKCMSTNLKRDARHENGKQRWKCKDCQFRSVTVIGMEQIDWNVDREVVYGNMKSMKKTDTLVITSAQNATPVWTDAVRVLERICEHKNAQLIVQPYRYKNPNSVFSDKDQDWWVDDVKPYLLDQRVQLHENLVLLGDIKIIPTAINPLRGLTGFTSSQSCILGHPKIDMESVATSQGELAKIMQTTGTVTVQNYTDSGAGKKGIHHHSFGAVIVELDGDRFHMRTVQVDDDGCVIDLDTKYYPDGRTERVSSTAVVVPDTHGWWVDEDASEALFGSGGLVDTIRPEHLLWHDIIDSYSISHHHRGDPFLKYAKHKNGFDNIQDELEHAIEFVEDNTPHWARSLIVNSNHHDHIDRYIRETDWRSDPENAEFYLETAMVMLQGTYVDSGGTITPDPFTYWVNKIAPSLVTLDPDESFKLHDFELGMHGHLGPNGSRGTAASLSRIGSKAIVGHYHSPCRKGGLMAVGTLSALNRDFAKGPSGWIQSVGLLYSNGKATHIHIIKGKYKK